MSNTPEIELSRGAVLRCLDCGSSNYPDHFNVLEVDCNHCHHRFQTTLPTTIESRHRQGALDLGFSALATWVRSIAAIASSPNTLLLEECPACKSVVTVPDTMPIQLSCRACGSVREFPIGEHAVDLIPEGNFTLEMRMGPGRYLDIRTHTDHRVVGLNDDASCPACDAPLPHFEGEHRCGSCDSLIVAWSRCGKRFFPGMVMKGHINRERLDGWYSLTEVHRLLEAPLSGMEPLMELMGHIPKIIGCVGLILFTMVGGMFGLFWLLGMLD